MLVVNNATSKCIVTICW